MKAINLIRWALRKTDEWMVGTAEDLRDTPMIPPTPRGGNHPLWTVGHVAFVEGDLGQVLGGEPNPVERWRPLFGQGSKPTADASAYPSYDEVLATYRELRARNLARLDAIGEAGLDRPSEFVPPDSEEEMKTVGTTLLVIALHQMSHLGQLAVARRAAGKEPRF